MDRHAEHEVGIPRNGRDILGLGLGIEGDAGLESKLVRGPDRPGYVVDRLEVERRAVAACLGDRSEVLGRPLDHEVHVDHTAAVVDERRDRRENDRAYRDRLDEMPVTDVEVEDPAAGTEQFLGLGAELREVRGVQRRLDLERAHPIVPRHRVDVMASAVR